MSRKPPSFVYFLQGGEGGDIKIGVSGNPAHRMADLQIGHGKPLQLLVVCTGSYPLETRLHRWFREHRRIGEWFAPGADLLLFIEYAKVCPEGIDALLAEMECEERERTKRLTEHHIDAWYELAEGTIEVFGGIPKLARVMATTVRDIEQRLHREFVGGRRRSLWVDHIAFTMTDPGARTFYLNGLCDLLGYEHPAPKRASKELGVDPAEFEP